MEQRSSMRKLVTLDTVLNYPGLGLVTGQSHDIGLGGMYVSTGRIQLPFHADINASLILDGTSCSHVQINARVVRCDDGGVGLRFDTLDIAIQDVLRILVYGENRVDGDMLSSLSIH